MSSLNFEENKSIGSEKNIHTPPVNIHKEVADDDGNIRWDFVGPKKHKKFLAELPGGLSENIRKAIAIYYDTYKGSTEESQLEQEIPKDEMALNTKKNRLKELKTARAAREDEQAEKERSIDEAHKELFEALKRYNWNPDRIQKAAYKIYADATGESVEKLKAWVEEQVKRRDELE